MTSTTTEIRAAHDAQLRTKRLWNGTGLSIFVLPLVSGLMAVNDRNAGGFWQGIPNVFDFPAYMIEEAIARAPEPPAFCSATCPRWPRR